MTEIYIKNQETEHSLESDKSKILSKSKNSQREITKSIEYSIAKTKLKKFMSGGEDSNKVSDEEMSHYHFDTVNWGRNRKPHPKMVIEEINTLEDGYRNEFKRLLMEDPADVLQLQRLLCELLHVEGYIDMDKLNHILDGTGMELDCNSHYGYDMKMDGMLGPQTYAVLCCFKKEHRRISTTNNNRKS